jgi:hypothetical protein
MTLLLVAIALAAPASLAGPHFKRSRIELVVPGTELNGKPVEATQGTAGTTTTLVHGLRFTDTDQVTIFGQDSDGQLKNLKGIDVTKDPGTNGGGDQGHAGQGGRFMVPGGGSVRLAERHELRRGPARRGCRRRWQGEARGRPTRRGQADVKTAPGAVLDQGSGSATAAALTIMTGEDIQFGGAEEPDALPTTPYVATQVVGDTWTWNGTKWKQLHPDHSPSPRSGARMAFDPTLKGFMLFGGFDGTNFLGRHVGMKRHGLDAAQADHSPPARASYGMAWDPPLKGLVLFGGFNGTSLLGTPGRSTRRRERGHSFT